LLLASAVETPIYAALDFTTLQGADGVQLSVVQTGNRQGPAILFIHGFSQSYLCWEKQLSDPRLKMRFHLIALDLRGHGASGKPSDAAAYGGEAWAGDIAAVIAATSERRPLVVAWSMGGSVLSSYIKRNGISHISGINLIGSSFVWTSVQFGPRDPYYRARVTMFEQMQSNDILVNMTGTRAFVSMLTAKPLAAQEADILLTYNMLTPAYVRRIIVAKSSAQHDFDDVTPQVTVPVLITFGTDDKLAPYQNAINTKRALPAARLSAYQGIGHAPFLEAPERFNRELEEFAVAASVRQ